MAHQSVDARTLRSWIAAGEAVVVDVREPAEFAGGHIPGAVSLPLTRLAREPLPDIGERRLVLVCASGRRSAAGCETLEARDGRPVWSLAGGTAAWQQDGGQVAREGRGVIPLERQVLAAAGLMVLAGMLLGTLVHPGFYAIAAFVGAGLTVAGLTGFCGMALLLARAPWNGGAARPGAAGS
jgi:rhodanese-related sulfurtransferase